MPATIKFDAQASIGRWFKRTGDAVSLNEPVVEIEIGNTTHEVCSPITGILSEILVRDGQGVGPDILLGTVTTY
ncbi:biotin/lipoyl-containing protein [Bradyrhizobium canariense]|uniref:biotin/lipoyl-containing protein n=1 Tax=Bradyrhizobium canariense TaxID=255045 RepID=UPI003D9B3B9A